MPIWIADYVLHLWYRCNYGCSSHDERDYEFARNLILPIIEVVAGGDVAKEAYTGDGEHVNSDFLNGLDKEEAIRK